jgi:hypothetical protein
VSPTASKISLKSASRLLLGLCGHACCGRDRKESGCETGKQHVDSRQSAVIKTVPAAPRGWHTTATSMLPGALIASPFYVRGYPRSARGPSTQARSTEWPEWQWAAVPFPPTVSALRALLLLPPALLCVHDHQRKAQREQKLLSVHDHREKSSRRAEERLTRHTHTHTHTTQTASPVGSHRRPRQKRAIARAPCMRHLAEWAAAGLRRSRARCCPLAAPTLSPIPTSTAECRPTLPQQRAAR